jgi:predicted component of type VI protein secretion system
MLQAELKILGGKHQGKLIPLNVKKFLVGREQDCHLRPNSDLVSRHHCVFSIDDYAVRLRDLGSTNGTLVNGNALRGEVILKAGDRVTIGKLELEVNIRQGATKTPPPAGAKQPALNEAVSNASPVVSTTEIPTVTTPVPEGDSSYELANVADAGTTQQIAAVPADTAIIGTFPGQYPQQNPMGYPQAYPPMMPQGYPMMGGYMPQQYPQYPPGYGQPMGYPPQQMGYPQMMPGQQGYPTAAPVVAEPSSPTPSTEMAVKLPDPAETGVKPVAPPAPAAPGAAGAAKKEEKPSNSAADIIKQYMSKRS